MAASSMCFIWNLADKQGLSDALMLASSSQKYHDMHALRALSAFDIGSLVEEQPLLLSYRALGS